jgi:hypothetical protein
MNLQKDTEKLDVFSEGRKRRIYVGRLTYSTEKEHYEFCYDLRYSNSKKAIPLGPELDLFKKIHVSKKKLFPSLADRIPSKSNPAYEEYCRSQGISETERNPIILLGTIGRRGPSTFVFEPVFSSSFSSLDIIRFRKQLTLSRNEFSLAFDFNEQTVHRVETNKSADLNLIRRAEIYFSFPDVALWQLRMTGSRIHQKTLEKLLDHFEDKKKSASSKKHFKLVE